MTNAEYIKLHMEKKKIEADLADKKAEIAEAEKLLVPKWQEEGQSKVTVGDTTIWLDHKIWASPTAVDDLAPELKRVGLGDLVKETINRQSLTGFVREQADPLASPEQIKRDLPHGLGTFIKVTETNNLRVRKK
jgi:hypothetical protein